ncbi:hypothetical protein ACSS6W_004242 [Trichoderma asperelloides]
MQCFIRTSRLSLSRPVPPAALSPSTVAFPTPATANGNTAFSEKKADMPPEMSPANWRTVCAACFAGFYSSGNASSTDNSTATLSFARKGNMAGEAQSV